MELKKYLQIINRRKTSIFFVFFLLMILVILAGLLIQKKYEATTSLRIIPPKIGGTNYVDFNLNYAARLMNTYSSMVSSTLVQNELKERLNLSEIPDIEAEVVAESELINITVLHSDPVIAANITNTVAEILVAQESKNMDEETVAAERIFSDRLENIKTELASVQTEYQALSVPYARANATMDAIANQIDVDQSLYNTLKDRYEINSQLVSPDTAKLTALSNQLMALETHINENLALLETMRMKAAQDAYDIEVASGKVAEKQRLYEGLVSQYDQMQTIEAFQNTNQLLVVDLAEPSDKAASPNLPWLYGLGTVVSFFTAMLLAFFIDNLDDTVYSTAEVEAVAQVPLLGTVSQPLHSNKVMKLNGEFREEVDVQRLQMNLNRLSKEKPLTSLVFSDIEPKNGKVPLSVKVAAEYARANFVTILIDANTRNPTLHHYFKNLNNDEGLTHVLKGKTPLERVIKNSGMANLFVLPAGEAHGNPAVALGSEKMHELIQALLTTFKMVVIDIAPLMYVSDSDELMTYVDGVLLVVERGRSSSSDIVTAVQHLETLKAPLLGCVVNGAEVDYKRRVYERKIFKHH